LRGSKHSRHDFSVSAVIDFAFAFRGGKPIFSGDTNGVPPWARIWNRY
jgi:hypothetical protein